MIVTEKCPSAYVETEIDGESVLMKLSDGKFYSLRDSGLAIWTAIDGVRDRDAIVTVVADDYDVAPGDVEADVLAFINSLTDAGLIAERRLS
ncbi:PqqD family protein [Croceicoccus sp. YJ47]|uniref:PqqD family protein n=1 Tax=Croceicoccus sp. YJ47 TaxID=2798724 RepID=UPI0019247B99|nr:PqqD family protein [Croceicoccus sp. YJ47]QQN72906.1 PqqD family protein [Croceicoccus sp. YJ47]